MTSINLAAQSKTQIINWLYDLPIKKNAKALKKAIQKNESFEEDDKSRSNDLRYLSSAYTGSILEPVLPITGRLDSAKVHFATGKLTSKEGYSGNMKWLRFEYFSTDTIFLNRLFDSACGDLKYSTKSGRLTGFRRNTDAVGEGVEFFYLVDSDKLRTISVLRVRYKTEIQSFAIHYAGSGD